MRKFNWRQHVVIVSMASLASTSSLVAGGYEVKAWNSDSIGEALAGSSVKEGDITTMTRNPASALGFMKSCYQASISLNTVIPSVKFKNKNSTTAAGARLTGGNGGNGGETAAIPAAYVGVNFKNQFQFGMAIAAPWGLATSYNSKWVGRYHAVKSKLRTLNIMPAASYRINNELAIGAGVQAQYMDVKLSRAIDYGGIYDSILPGIPFQDDGQITVKGNDWGYGWNAGLFYRPLQNLRFGLSYNSQISHKLKGNAKFSANATRDLLRGFGPALNSKFSDQSVRASIKTPERVILGAAWDFQPQFTLLGEVVHTRWNRMKEINIQFPTTIAAADVTPMNWKNTASYHIGLNWRPLTEWTFRTGYAYDPTPVRDDYRIPSVPDQSRHWATLGATWLPARLQGLSLSMNYAHEFIRNAKSNLRVSPGTPHQFRGNLIGKYKANVNIIGAQLNWRF